MDAQFMPFEVKVLGGCQIEIHKIFIIIAVIVVMSKRIISSNGNGWMPLPFFQQTQFDGKETVFIIIADRLCLVHVLMSLFKGAGIG